MTSGETCTRVTRRVVRAEVVDVRVWYSQNIWPKAKHRVVGRDDICFGLRPLFRNSIDKMEKNLSTDQRFEPARHLH